MAESVRDNILATLLPCSFRGVPFLFDGGSVVGGHRATERGILHSTEQIVSVVGLRQRAYSIQGFIAARESVDQTSGTESAVTVGATYSEHRAALLAAFEDPEPATFVHPIEGAIQGLIAHAFSISERQDEWGRGSVSVEFIRDTRKSTPVPDLGVAGVVLGAADASKASFLDSLVERWHVDPAIVGAYEDGLTKARAAFETMQTIADEAEQLTDAVDAVAQVMSEGIAAATRLILTPARLAQDIGGALSVLATIFPSAVTAFDGMVNGFTFGDLDFSIDISAPSAQTRKGNADAMNVTMKGVFLAQAYAFATGIDYVTLDEIARVEGLLDDQFGAIVDAGTATSESLDTLENLRTAFASFLDRARLSARRTTIDDTAPTTPRVLAYGLYGEDSLAATLAGLNGVLAYETIAGRVTVLSS